MHIPVQQNQLIATSLIVASVVIARDHRHRPIAHGRASAAPACQHISGSSPAQLSKVSRDWQISRFASSVLT